MSWIRLRALAASTFLLGCNGSMSQECQPGTIGCACVEGTCDVGLVCRDAQCLGSEPTSGTPMDPSAPGPGGTSGSLTSGGPPDAETGGGGGSSESGAAGPGGPEIIDFGTNVTELSEGESVVFTATVIDPDGPSDIQGGRLETEDQSATYGAFTDTGEGTFEISLSWAELDQVESILLEGSTARSFRAEFFDNTGKQASRTVSIVLSCDPLRPAVCGSGTCISLQSDPTNCGTCGNACPLGPFGQAECQAGGCQPELSACFDAAAGASTCTDYCTSLGQACLESAAMTSLGSTPPSRPDSAIRRSSGSSTS